GAAAPETTPPAVRRILQRCLERDPQQRPGDIAEVKHELNRALVDLQAPTAAAVTAPARRAQAAQRWLFAVAGLALIVLVSLFVLRQTTSPSAVAEPPLQLTDFNDSVIHPAVSPDG